MSKKYTSEERRTAVKRLAFERQVNITLEERDELVTRLRRVLDTWVPLYLADKTGHSAYSLLMAMGQNTAMVRGQTRNDVCIVDGSGEDR